MRRTPPTGGAKPAWCRRMWQLASQRSLSSAACASPVCLLPNALVTIWQHMQDKNGAPFLDVQGISVNCTWRRRQFNGTSTLNGTDFTSVLGTRWPVNYESITKCSEIDDEGLCALIEVRYAECTAEFYCQGFPGNKCLSMLISVKSLEEPFYGKMASKVECRPDFWSVPQKTSIKRGNGVSVLQVCVAFTILPTRSVSLSYPCSFALSLSY
jgi:hypothetical protein